MSVIRRVNTSLIHVMSVALLMAIATGCQRAVQEDVAEGNEEAPMVMGQNEDGSKVMYGVACLRKFAAQIQQDGRAAAQRCVVQSIDKDTYDRGVRGTAKTEYTYIYYPYSGYWYPPYWGGSSNYGNGVTNNGFCNRVFGISWGSSNSCISAIFGWGGNYQNYGTTCSQCQYKTNPSSCYRNNGCWGASYYNYYFSPYAY